MHVNSGSQSPRAATRMHVPVPTVLIGLVMVAVAVAPHGWHITPVSDGWFVVRDNLESFSFRGDLTRVFGNWPTALGLALTPSSTVGLQVLLVLLLLLRGIGVAILASKMGLNQTGVTVCGVLSMAYPADTGLFWVGALGFHSAVVVFVFAVVAILDVVESGHLLSGALAGLLLVISLWTHPVVLPLAGVIPLLALADARVRADRKRIATMVALLGIALINLAHILWSLSLGGGRNQQVAEADLDAFVAGFAQAASVVFWRGWASAVERSTPWTIAVGVLAGVTWLLLSPRTSDHASTGSMRSGVLGFLWIVLGYLLFAASTVRFDTQRTLLMASLGAALVAGSLAAALRNRIACALMLAVVTAVSSAHLAADRASWAERSLRQQELLGAIAARVPAPKPGAGFVVWFEDPAARELVQGLANRDLAMTYALGVLFDDPGIVAVSRVQLSKAFVLEQGSLVLPLVVDDEIGVRPAARVHVLPVDLDGVHDPLEMVPERVLPEWDGPRLLAESDPDMRPVGRVCSMLTPELRPPTCSR